MKSHQVDEITYFLCTMAPALGPVTPAFALCLILYQKQFPGEQKSVTCASHRSCSATAHRQGGRTHHPMIHPDME